MLAVQQSEDYTTDNVQSDLGKLKVVKPKRKKAKPVVEKTVESSGFKVLDISGKTAGVVSKERANKFGEVLTPQWMIDYMLDSFEEETKTDDHPYLNSPSDMWSRAFEPGFGQGGFTLEIFRRKLKDMYRLFGDSLDITEDTKRTQPVYDRWRNGVLWILTSIYGIDLQEDNVRHTQNAMLELALDSFTEKYGKKLQLESDFVKSAKFIISKNLLYGDALTFTNPDTEEKLEMITWVPVVKGTTLKKVIDPHKALTIPTIGLYRYSDWENLEGGPIHKHPLLGIWRAENLIETEDLAE